MGRIKVVIVVALLVLGAAQPSGAVVTERGSVAGSGRFTGTEPDIPEKLLTVTIAATNEHDRGLECVGPFQCPPLGSIEFVSSDARSIGGRVDCLSVNNHEAFLSGFLSFADRQMPFTALVIDRTLEPNRLPDEFGIIIGRPERCRDEAIRAELRTVTGPVNPGDMTIVDPCRFLVCPADRS